MDPEINLPVGRQVQDDVIYSPALFSGVLSLNIIIAEKCLFVKLKYKILFYLSQIFNPKLT